MNKSITPSTDDVALLRALSRRSAVLRVDPDEASIVVERQGRPVVVAIVQPAQIARFETAGWLRAGASGHRLSRSGVAALRRVLADPAAKPVVLAHSNKQPQAQRHRSPPTGRAR